MADYRSLVIVAGVTRQIVNGDRVIAPSGVVSAGADLTLEAAATYAINVGTAVATQVNVGSATAPVSVGGLLYANTLDRAAAGALTIGGTNATSVVVGKAGVAVTMAGGVLTNSVDQATAGTLSIGTTTATGITVGKVGVLTTIAGDLQVNGAETVIGLTTFTGDAQFNGNVVFGNAVTDTVAFQSVIGNGTYNDLIFRQGNTHTLKAAAAAAGAGGIGNTMRYLGGDGAPADATTPGGAGGYADFRAGVAGAGSAAQIAGSGRDAVLQGGDAGVDGGAGGNFGGAAIVNGGLGTNGTHGAVTLGSSHTAHIYLGPTSGVATPITQQSTAQVTFNGPIQCNNNVVFGNAATDTVAFRSVIGDGTYDDLVFRGINAHTVKAASPAAGAGVTILYKGGDGIVAGAGAGTVGGTAIHYGGQGGDGTAGQAAGPGGAAYYAGGKAGANAGGGGANGGASFLRGGEATGAGIHGAVIIGDAETSLIALGALVSGAPIVVRSVIGDGVDNDIRFSKDDAHNLKVENQTTGDAAGNSMWVAGGDGGPASATGGGVGGSFYGYAGVGGSGTALLPAGAGGQAGLWAGSGGIAVGGVGAAGGTAIVKAGDSSAAVKGGSVEIGAGWSDTGQYGDINIGLPLAFDIVISCVNKIALTGLFIETNAEYQTTSRIRLGETTTPSTVSNNGFLYTKDVAGVTELFWRDDTNVELQVTTNGQLNVAASTSSPKVVFTGTARATISSGAPVCLNYDGANSGVFNADANGTGTGTQRCIGLADAATTATNPAYVVTAGAKATADAIWDAVPAVTDVGKPAYLSENVGKLTLTAPTTIGSVVQVVGSVSVGGTGNVAVLVQPQAPVLL